MPDAFGNCRRYRKEYEFLSDFFTGEILKIVIDITSQSEIEKQSTIQKIIICWTNKYNMDEQKASDLVEFFVRAFHENNDNQGFKKVRKSEEQGDTNEQWVRGNSYLFGRGENQDYAKAVDLYSKAAKQGYANAQFMLAQCYHHGFGIGVNYDKAVKWYSKAAKQGNANAQFILGQVLCFSCCVNADIQHVVEWGLELQEQGDRSYDNARSKWFNFLSGIDVKSDWDYSVQITQPQFILPYINCNQCYSVNCGVIIDREQAVEWCSKAAKQGDDAVAQFILGQCYLFGCGVIVNCIQAAEGYRFEFIWCFVNDSTQDSAKAVECYKEAANRGYANAQFMLSQCYFFGLGVDKDYAKAVEWLHKSSALRSAAMMARDHYTDRGKRYFYGLGVDKDYEMAADWFCKSALLGDANAQFMLGQCYFFGFGVKKRDREQAVKWYSDAARQGVAVAQFMLGQCYFFGFGVKKRDREQAVKWYSDAARHGVAVAQFMLGQCYFFGFGVKKEDRKQAVELYREAAGGDIPDTQLNYDVTTNVTTSWKWQIRKCHYRAQFMLGQCYLFGCGVKKDYSKAEDWYLKLLLFGGKDIGAQFMYDQCFYLRCGADKDYEMAADWFCKSALLGDADAQFMLGQHFFFGCDDVEKDYAKAVDWYRKAAEQNNACAQCALGDCYFYGFGKDINWAEAAKLYSKAAKQGDACAQCALGDCYFYGFGKDIDWAEAAKLYSKAEEKGDAYAGLMLRNFCGVNQ